MITQDYVDKISVRFRRYPDAARMLPSAESLLKGLAVVMVVLILATGYTKGLASLPKDQTQVVRVTVARGGTLWQYASQHGSKDRYILSRVEEIARINHIAGSKAIQPGDEILIPK